MYYIYNYIIYIYILMRDEEGKNKEASEVKQTTRQRNIPHPRQLLFQRKNELPRVGFEPTCTRDYMRGGGNRERVRTESERDSKTLGLRVGTWE